MYYFLRGIVDTMKANLVVLDVNGVGYACNTTSYTQSQLNMGKEVKLYTILNVKEDAMDIYGFATEEEKECFEMLTSVSGVGPKAALSILSTSSPSQLKLSIISENEKAITAAPGIGKKIAQRVILELKDKLAKESATISTKNDFKAVSNTTIPENKVNEASAALSVLGFNPPEIAKALKSIDMEQMSVEQIIKAALKLLR